MNTADLVHTIYEMVKSGPLLFSHFVSLLGCKNTLSFFYEVFYVIAK